MVKKNTFIRRTARKAVKYVKKVTGDRYGRGTKQIMTKGIPQLYKDVANLKWLMNVEKKQYNNPSAAPISIASVFGNVSGHQVIDITPTPALGNTSTQRDGDSIKVVSAYHKFQFFQQADTNSPIKIIVEYFVVRGKPNTSGLSVLQDLYNPNRYITAGAVSGTVYDMNSDRQQEQFRNFYKLCTKRITLQADQNTSQLQIKELIIKLRLKNHHVRFDPTSGAVVAGQIYMVIRADNGNASAVASTLTNVINKTPLTGGLFNLDHTWYYTDN